MTPLISSLLATLIISLISFLGIIFILVKSKILSKITLFLVSFAIGSLLGDAFIHLIPESFEFFDQKFQASLLVLGGLILFFILEKIIRWHHCHQPEAHHSHQIVPLNLIGDGVHNFIDGILIAASFNVSQTVGITTALAVVLHEIPQEIGDFGLLIHHGVSIKKSLLYNFLSALTSLLGVFLVYFISSNIENFSNYLLPITAGGFIYLAATDLIPELHRHDTKIGQSMIQLIFIILGITLMSLLLFLE